MRAGEAYFSTDVETDGPIPGPNSMLSLGTAVYDEEGHLIDTFSVNLTPLPGAAPDPSTAAWWLTQPDAWAAVSKDRKDAVDAMREYVDWVKGLRGSGKPVFVGYPAGFDFTFVYWYCIRFTGECPFSFSALDIKTMAMTMLRLPYRETVKKNMPKSWFDSSAKHTHVALDDALEQGATFCRMLKENKAQLTESTLLAVSKEVELWVEFAEETGDSVKSMQRIHDLLSKRGT